MMRAPKVGAKRGVVLKDAIIAAAESVGFDGTGTDGLTGYLRLVATVDVKAFCSLLGRVLPLTLKGDGEGGGIIVEIVKRTYATEAHGDDPTSA
jgi:hypothetical protein